MPPKTAGDRFSPPAVYVPHTCVVGGGAPKRKSGRAAGTCGVHTPIVGMPQGQGEPMADDGLRPDERARSDCHGGGATTVLG